MSSRHYCFTAFTEPNSAEIKENEQVEYCCYAQEVCPSTGKIHWQGYIELTKAQRPSFVKKVFNDKTLHLEVRKGSRQQARDYCKKTCSDTNPFLELGTWIEDKSQNQGKRNDLQIVKDLIKSGMSLQTAIEQNLITNEMQLRVWNKLTPIFAPKRNEKPLVIWLHGKTGVGKSRIVHTLTPDEELYSPVSFKWWDGYGTQHTILLEDFRGSFCQYNELLRLLDRYPLKVEIKGSVLQLSNKIFFITSPLSPEEVYPTVNENKDSIQQLLRRIDHVYEVTHHNYHELIEEISDHILLRLS